ncbi:hypothetical protein [Nannocystis pusilla]|uniref:Lipoprotein n=1 Tax=Nannocystis pusilla TaxID=889268 RepID=A0ABS7U164_9BACT|nr:hypothetical protein [Nannocystis pusilla]MBZ5714046.1 hypothetical protein [Nannocystis pusilla]
MRDLGLTITTCCWLLAGCTSLNPAWLSGTTDDSTASAGTEPGSDSTGAPATTSTAGPGTTDALTTSGTDPTITGGPVTVGETDPVTTDPVTGGPDTTTDIEPGTTTGGEGCFFPNGLELELVVNSTEPQLCDAINPRQIYAEVLGQAGPGRWKFNVCGDKDACKDPQAECPDSEHLTFVFEGEPSLVPEFQAGECHHLDFLARAALPDDPFTCKLRALRVAHTGFTPELTQYVGAIDTPGSDGLPMPIDWSALFGFTVVASVDTVCQTDMPACFPSTGSYSYVVTREDKGTEHVVLEGETFEEVFAVATDNQDEVEVTGTFTDVRSRIEPGVCGTGQDFRWAWLATFNGP